MRRRLERSLRAIALTAVVSLVGGCGGGDDEGACGRDAHEALDPAYLVHVIGTDADLEYTSDPPTSGPHQPSPPVSGVVDDPITRPIQVGILERGDVLLHHHPDLGDEELGRLADLADDGVVIAPNPDLAAPVVATAWLYKLSCDAVDPPALEEFIDEHRGEGPEQ